MNNDTFLEQLNELFSHEYNSVADYVLGSNPYCEEHERFALKELEKIRDEDKQHALKISTIITRLEGLPIAGTFPYSIADINYLSIKNSIHYVLEDKEKLIGLYERVLKASKKYPSVQAGLMPLLEDQKKHVKLLNATIARFSHPEKQSV